MEIKLFAFPYIGLHRMYEMKLLVEEVYWTNPKIIPIPVGSYIYAILYVFIFLCLVRIHTQTEFMNPLFVCGITINHHTLHMNIK